MSKSKVYSGPRVLLHLLLMRFFSPALNLAHMSLEVWAQLVWWRSCRKSPSGRNMLCETEAQWDDSHNLPLLLWGKIYTAWSSWREEAVLECPSSQVPSTLTECCGFPDRSYIALVLRGDLWDGLVITHPSNNQMWSNLVSEIRWD